VLKRKKRWVRINKNRHSEGSKLIRNNRRNYRRTEIVIVFKIIAKDFQMLVVVEIRIARTLYMKVNIVDN
jgi:hypothetical protein